MDDRTKEIRNKLENNEIKFEDLYLGDIFKVLKSDYIDYKLLEKECDRLEEELSKQEVE